MGATLVIPGGFNGPPASANGGYACGRLAVLAAAHLDGRAGVALHAPVPLETPLEYVVSGRRAHVWSGDELVATVSSAGRPVPPVEAASPDAAKAAEEDFAGRRAHPFPTCFVCGVDRTGDGIGLAPGPLPGRPDTVACTWAPGPAEVDEDGVVRPEIIWSVLDCPGGWTTDPATSPRVLSWMTTEVIRPPRAGRTYVIVARLDGPAGDAAANVSALYDPAAAEPLARAAATWLPPAG